ncbi:MAG: alkaline phosphatase family protein [Myxococcota bacterium]|nr:alkaline phosphatase family protein [Myxococcota bacterium]
MDSLQPTRFPLVCIVAASALIVCSCDSNPGGDSAPSADVSADQRVDLGDLPEDAGIRDAVTPTGQDMNCQRVFPTLLPTNERRRSSDHRVGIDRFEDPHWLRISDAILDDPEALFVATYRREIDRYVIRSGTQDSRRELILKKVESRAGEWPFQIEVGRLTDVFPNVNPRVLGDYEQLLSNFVNPNDLGLEDLGYSADDVRVGFLPRELEVYPYPLLRLVSLFDSDDAPDLVYGVRPHANGVAGTHGGLDLLQSRATLILSGPGFKAATVLDDDATLVDIAPTVLAAFDAPTTGGQGAWASYADGLHLRWQDGRVLTEALDATSCVRPKHMVLILFDGLLATEINRQLLSDEPDVQLPNLRHLAQGGVVYRYGAISGFPSYSAPGHVTVGTGLWPGHHGVLSNRFYGRAEQRAITPFDLLDNLPYFIQNPREALSLYDRLVKPEAENLAQAIHRSFGEYDPDTRTGAFVAVINELTFKGADFTTLGFFGDGGVRKKLFEYRAADAIAMTQLEVLLTDQRLPVPKFLQMSLLATDAAGEDAGPHSPLLRSNLVDIDERIGQIFDLLDARGVLEQTAFVLTSDHGMALQDRTRRATIRDRIRAAQVKTSMVSGGLIYLRGLVLEVIEDRGNFLRIVALDADNGVPVSDAQLACLNCDNSIEQMSDREGQGDLSVPATATELVIQATHPRFNSATLRYRRP